MIIDPDIYYEAYGERWRVLRTEELAILEQNDFHSGRVRAVHGQLCIRQWNASMQRMYDNWAMINEAFDRFGSTGTELARTILKAGSALDQLNTVVLWLMTPAQRRRYWRREEREAKWERYREKLLR